MELSDALDTINSKFVAKEKEIESLNKTLSEWRYKANTAEQLVTKLQNELQQLKDRFDKMGKFFDEVKGK